MRNTLNLLIATALAAVVLAGPAAAEDTEPKDAPKNSSAVPVIVKGSDHDETEGALCQAALAAMGAEFEVLGPVDGKGDCHVKNAVRLRSLPHGIKVTAPATLNCSMALMLSAFALKDLKEIADKELGKMPTSINTGTSYHCRGRNNVKGARLSEHAYGNGVDIMSFSFAGRDAIKIGDELSAGAPERTFLAKLGLQSCKYFTTVLGPSSDASHHDHWHFDIRARRGDYRICFKSPD